jgi:hypothetical protein
MYTFYSDALGHLLPDFSRGSTQNAITIQGGKMALLVRAISSWNTQGNTGSEVFRCLDISFFSTAKFESESHGGISEWRQ